ncbi:glycosyltransferase [Candidatus Deianiraea vastatrix]|uniref:Cell coat glycosyltransferase family 1 n=1 Tax=Candidatus Deianiraea vastatrix TaxID=2163644 RepID=A0A5B8XFN7_9RICK|nr:glycosyltransferase [Candidatus Deianiraea vastatrix]QED22827.1 Putative cell coat glycosyltransferase family 1 [Candidatus Deianiraea vastatrix]
MKNNDKIILNAMIGAGIGGLEEMGIKYSEFLPKVGYKVISLFNVRSVLYDKMKNIPYTCFILPFSNYDIFTAFSIAKIVKKYSVTHVIMHGRKAQKMLLLARFFMKKKPKFIFIEHCEISEPESKKTDIIAVLNTGARQKMLKYGIPSERIVNIDNFVDLSDLKFTQREKKDVPTIGWMQRFHPIKGLEMFLKAVVILQKKGYNFNVSIAGGSIKDIDFPMPDAINLEKIEFLSWINDVQHFMDNIDIFCISSLDEPFGLATLKALACGVPVVATPTSGSIEILSRSENPGIVSSEMSEESLAIAIENMLNKSQEEFARSSMQAYHASRFYTIDNWAKTIHNILL